MERPTYVLESKRGVLLEVYVQPGAAEDAPAGLHGGALKLRVRAPAEGGRANRAAERLVASLLDVPPRSVAVVSGAHGRRKRIVVRQTSVERVTLALKRVLSSRAHEPR